MRYSNGRVYSIVRAETGYGGEIHSINTDGSGDRLIYANRDSGGFPFFAPYPEGWLMAASDGRDTWVYFTMGNFTKEVGYRIKSDGTGLEPLVNAGIGDCFVGAQTDSFGTTWIYYRAFGASPAATLAEPLQSPDKRRGAGARRHCAKELTAAEMNGRVAASGK